MRAPQYFGEEPLTVVVHHYPVSSLLIVSLLFYYHYQMSLEEDKEVVEINCILNTDIETVHNE